MIMRKILLILTMVALALCLFAIGVSADTVYVDESGNELFRYQKYDGTEEGYVNYLSNTIKSYQGEFPIYDNEGNALTWYVVSTQDINGDTVKTVASFKTIDDGTNATLNDNGAYSYKNQARELSVVSAYFPDDCGVLTLSLSDNGYGASYSFSYGSELLFLRLPNTLTVLPGRVVQSTPVIDFSASMDAKYTSFDVTSFHDCKNLRFVDISNNVTILYSNGHSNNGNTFFSCVNLIDVDFGENSKLETIQINAFNQCRSLKEITIPNSVKEIQARAFQDCSSLETIRMGANVGVGLTEYNVQSMLWGCNSLKYVYMPDSLVPTSGSHLFKSGANDMVIFYTGTYEQYEALLATLKSLKDNEKFTSATPIEWNDENSDQYYKDLATNEKKCYVVYGYGKCEAFYGGHSWSGVNNVIVGSYFDTIKIGDSCINCQKADVKSTIAPIFVWKGYSKSTYGDTYAVVQGFYIDRDSLAQYKVYAPDFDFGIMATGNAKGEAINPQIGDEKVFTAIFDNTVNDYYDIKVTGITEELMDKNIVFCIYVLDGGKMYYLDGEKTADTVIGISYNDIIG